MKSTEVFDNEMKKRDELESDMSKKQKIDEHVEVEKDDQEEAKMKRHIEIVKMMDVTTAGRINAVRDEIKDISEKR
ncbi:hypothetical protein Tco_0784983 [Tanacetum coccineum]